MGRTQKYENKKMKGRLGRGREKDYMRQKGRTQYGFQGLGDDDDEGGFRRNNRSGGGDRSFGGRDGGYGNRNQRDTDNYGFDSGDTSERRFGSRSRDSGRRPTHHRDDDDF